MVRRWGWAVGAAWLVDGLVLVKFPVLGVCVRLVPGVVYLAGVEGGPEVGAKCGLLGGGLLWICGGSASQMAILALLGGMAGEVVHKNASKWGKWLASIPLLVGAEALVVGVHWLGESFDYLDRGIAAIMFQLLWDISGGEVFQAEV